MKFSKLIFAIAALSLSAGCFKPGGHPQSEKTATFYVEEVKGSSQVSSTSTNWNLPTARTYNFQVMVKNSHSKEAVINHNFIIQDASGNVINSSVRTNSDGYLSWSEVIPFNYLADTKFIPLTRVVVANGIHTGKMPLRIAINPWYERHKRNQLVDVVDLNKVKISPDLLVVESDSQLHLSGQKQFAYPRRRLYIDGMIVSMSHTGPNSVGANKTIKLDMMPQILLHDIYRNLEGIGLQKAKFKIEVALIARMGEGDKTARYLLGRAESDKIQPMIGDRVRFDLLVHQIYGSSMGQAELAIKLIPIDGPEDLDPFEGVFMIGNYDQNTGFVGNVPTLTTMRDDYKFTVSQYLEKSVIDPKKFGPEPLPSGIFAIEPYEFAFIDPRFSQVNIAQETPTSRTCEITFQTTVTNPMDGNRGVRDAEFEIIGIDGVPKKRKTNQYGQLTWTDQLTYQPYKFKHYISKNVTFKSTSSGWNKSFTVKINPWSQFGYALGMDNRLVSQDQMDKAKRLDYEFAIKPQVYIGKYVLALNENLVYSINDDLSVDPYKSFIINLNPYILTYNDPINGMDSVYAFRDGMYLLKIGVVSVIGGQRFVTTYKKLVNVRNSQINEPIRLHLPDLRQMRIRNLLYVEFHAVDYKKLTPFLILTKGRAQFTPPGEKISLKNLDDIIDHDAGLEPRTFVGVFTPFQVKSENPLRPTDDLDEVFDVDNKIGSFTSDKNLTKHLSAANAAMKYMAPNEKDLQYKKPQPETERLKEEMLPAERANIPITNTITPDNLTSAFRGLTTFLALMQDPQFNSGKTFESNADITQFVTRALSPVIKPITVADLEHEETMLAEARKRFSDERRKKENFVANAYAEYVQLQGTAKEGSGNAILPKDAGLKTLLQVLNLGNFTFNSTNAIFPDKNRPVKSPDEKEKSEGKSFWPDWIVNFGKSAQDFLYEYVWREDQEIYNRPHYFEFDTKEIEKLLPQFEPVSEENKKAIHDLMTNYFSTHQNVADLTVNFDLPNWQIKTGQSISKIAATRLCYFWHNVMLSSFKRKDDVQSLTQACIRDVINTNDMESVFVLDQKIRVLERGRYIMEHGYFNRLNIGSDVRASYGQSSAESTNISVTPLRAISFLPDFIIGVFGWTLFQKNLSKDMAESKSASLGAGIPISTEEARFFMVINAYERCSIIRMNPEYVARKNLLSEYSIDESSKALGWFKRGLMICTGKEERTPFLAPESFYYLTPDPFDGSALEISDPRSYKWVIGFRGPRDYTEFFNMLKTYGVDTYGGRQAEHRLGRRYFYSDLMGNDVQKLSRLKRPVDANQKPTSYIELGISGFRNSSGGLTTTYPGVYTVP